MATAQFKLYKQRSGQRHRELVSSAVFGEPKGKVNMPWVKAMIRRRYPSFVISGTLILIVKQRSGYVAMRACSPKPPENYVWAYLEVTALQEEPDKKPPLLPASKPSPAAFTGPLGLGQATTV